MIALVGAFNKLNRAPRAQQMAIAVFHNTSVIFS
jgi:hypothetical protein